MRYEGEIKVTITNAPAAGAVIVDCPACRATGRRGGLLCPTCRATGYVLLPPPDPRPIVGRGEIA